MIGSNCTRPKLLRRSHALSRHRAAGRDDFHRWFDLTSGCLRRGSPGRGSENQTPCNGSPVGLVVSALRPLPGKSVYRTMRASFRLARLSGVVVKFSRSKVTLRNRSVPLKDRIFDWGVFAYFMYGQHQASIRSGRFDLPRELNAPRISVIGVVRLHFVGGFGAVLL
jgi:hypothetical protein